MRDKASFEYIYPLAKGYRILPDSEGYPYLPGKHGNIEWHQKGTLALYTQKVRMVSKFLAIPGVQKHQMGDFEARMLLPVSSLPLVLRVARIRRKRSLSSEKARELGRGTAYQGGSDDL